MAEVIHEIPVDPDLEARRRREAAAQHTQPLGAQEIQVDGARQELQGATRGNDEVAPQPVVTAGGLPETSSTPEALNEVITHRHGDGTEVSTTVGDAMKTCPFLGKLAAAGILSAEDVLGMAELAERGRRVEAAAKAHEQKPGARQVRVKQESASSKDDALNTLMPKDEQPRAIAPEQQALETEAGTGDPVIDTGIRAAEVPALILREPEAVREPEAGAAEVTAQTFAPVEETVVAATVLPESPVMDVAGAIGRHPVAPQGELRENRGIMDAAATDPVEPVLLVTPDAFVVSDPVTDFQRQREQALDPFEKMVAELTDQAEEAPEETPPGADAEWVMPEQAPDLRDEAKQLLEELGLPPAIDKVNETDKQPHPEIFLPPTASEAADFAQWEDEFAGESMTSPERSAANFAAEEFASLLLDAIWDAEAEAREAGNPTVAQGAEVAAAAGDPWIEKGVGADEDAGAPKPKVLVAEVVAKIEYASAGQKQALALAVGKVAESVKKLAELAPDAPDEARMQLWQEVQAQSARILAILGLETQKSYGVQFARLLARLDLAAFAALAVPVALDNEGTHEYKHGLLGLPAGLSDVTAFQHVVTHAVGDLAVRWHQNLQRSDLSLAG